MVAALVTFFGAFPLVFGPDTSGDVLAAGERPVGATLRWYLLPLLLIPLTIGVWGLRAGTEVSRNGLRLRALFGQRWIPWSRVAALGADPRGRAVAQLADGHQVRLPGVRAGDLPRLVAASGQELSTPRSPD